MLGHRLFIETLRVPFGDDWGGETFLYTPLGHRLSLGLLMRRGTKGSAITSPAPIARSKRSSSCATG